MNKKNISFYDEDTTQKIKTIKSKEDRISVYCQAIQDSIPLRDCKATQSPYCKSIGCVHHEEI